ncbi:MAG: hypothetical protein JWM11_48 [Planctomycetaceae bacterium]|nr:hypothetical protein [Planctomycetaceae bacterium]
MLFTSWLAGIFNQVFQTPALPGHSKRRLQNGPRLSVECLEDRALLSAFTPGDLVIYRTGGTGALSSAASAITLDEYTPAGVLVQSIALPTTASGSNNVLTDSGQATSEGMLTLSADGTELVLTGYDALVGKASITSTATTLAITGATNASPIVITSAAQTLTDGTPVTISSVGGNTAANGNYFAKFIDGTHFSLFQDSSLTTPVTGNAAYTSGGSWTTATAGAGPVQRVVGLVTSDGTINTSTTTTALSATNIRSAVADGNKIWIVGGTTGVVEITAGTSGPGTIVSSTVANLRTINIVNGQLYFGTGSGATRGVYQVGTGEPTTAGTTSTSLASLGGSASPYQFYFADLSSSVAGVDTLYVADDTPGTITKFSLVSGSWVSNGTITAATVRGLTGAVNGTSVTLYGTDGPSAAGGTSILYTVTDTAGYNAAPSTTTATTLKTSATDIGWRGIAFSPDEGTGSITGLGGTTNYHAGDAPTIIGGSVAFSDLSNFMGGKLIVSENSGGTASDQLSVNNQGTGASQISISSGTISFGNVVLGTVDATNNGSNGAPLQINFNSVAVGNDVVAAAVQALMKQITFSSTGAGGNRVVKFEVRENNYSASNSATFSSATQTVDVTASSNTPPTITSNGGGDTASVTVAENTTTVTTVIATDTETPATLTYSKSGTDASFFSIDPDSGALTFTTAPNFENPLDNGGNNVYDVIVTVTDGGSLTDSQSIAVTVANRNEAPQGTDKTVATNKNTDYTFTTADFGFSDPSDVPANALFAVTITTLPGVGTLKDNGNAVTAGQSIPVGDITGSHLTFTPASNATGSPYTTFTFQVQDNGGTTNAGDVDLDQSANTITVNVTAAPNHAPSGTDNSATINEDAAYTFATADFGFTDSNDTPANNLLAVEVTTLPGAGSLTDNNVAVTAGQFIAVADIIGGLLKFTPVGNANGTGYASFTFQVQDDGGTVNSGVDLDQSANTFTLNVTSVNDAPAGTTGTVTTNEDSVYTFATADFGFTDPNDTPVNNLLAVKITTLPGAGTFTDNNVTVTAGQFIPVADIVGGLLTFAPAANANGASHATFTFQVQDDGGHLE